MLLQAVLLTTVLGVHVGGDAGACLGRGVLGTAIGGQFHVLHIEEELATTFGIAPEQALTIFTNVSVGPLMHGVRPYAVLGAGRMVVFSAVDATTGFAWNWGGGVEVFKGHVGVRVDVRYVQGPFTYVRIATGFVVQAK